MLKRAFDFHGLDIELTRPKSIDGKQYPIGEWNYEGMYDRFKTLGAKRYVYEQDGKQHITIAGLNKKKPIPYMTETWGDVFEALHDGMYIPPEWTGKQTHKYIDEPKEALITDYQGHQTKVSELSSVHLSGCEFTLSLTSEYLNILKGIKERIVI